MKRLTISRAFDRHQHLPLWRWIPTLIALVVIGWVLRHTSTAATLLAVNSFEVVDWMMQDCLDLLVNKLALGSHMNTEVQKEFEHDFAPGETVRVKYPQEYLIRDGLARVPNPINRRHTDVSCTQIFGIDYDWDSYERALKMERGEDVIRREYHDPAMAQLAQEVESRVASYMYKNASAMIGVLGTDPTDYDTSSAAARQKLVELGCPAGKDRGVFFPPSVIRALKKSSISYFNPVTDIAKAFRTGIAGSGDGFDFYESVSLYQHTAGHWAGAVTTTQANQSGATLTITATGGDTFKEGDKFSITSVNNVNPRTRRKVGASAKTFTILADLTAAGGGADVISISPAIYGPGSPYQNVDALPGALATMTLWPGTSNPNDKVGTVSLAVQPDAFALVGVEFPIPKQGGSIVHSKSLTDEETGINLTFLHYFDPDLLRWSTRWDMCLGFGRLWSDNCAVAIAGA
jgi:hypothetical protein